MKEPQVSVEKGGGRIRIPGWLVAVAGIPLLAAMTTEFLAVLARNTGWNIVGSIELVQALILLSTCGAIVIATLNRSHAKVTVLSRLYSGHTGRALRTLLAISSAIFFFALAVGSTWIAIDMWHSYERSELLGVPYLPLRIIVSISMFAVAVIYALRLVTELRR
jgi:TRAP-type transport system small permease protein